MRVLVTGGGTGGHVYPALAIARGIREQHPEAEILFVGTSQGIEADIVPREGFAFRMVSVEGLPREKLSLRTLRTVLKTVKGTLQAYRILKEFKPSAVIGTGGYVCFPVVMTASLQGVPTLIHEQNAFPGLTNRLLARRVTKVAVTFPESKKYFTSKADIVLTGLPVRPEVKRANRDEGIAAFGLDANRFTILVTGGSQGARSINRAMQDVIPRICGMAGVQLIHITGPAGFDETVRELESRGINPDRCGNITVKPYIYNMAEALAAANLVICRAGATTIAEITVRGLPSILIPYPYATANHQEYNAAALVNAGAAKMIVDRDLTGETLWETLRGLFENQTGLAGMADKSRLMGKPEALGHLLRIINEIKRP